MPWFKVDDGFASSRKVISIPRQHRLPAIGAWTMAGNFAARELTDGHVPQYYLDEIGATDDLVQILIKADLWLADEDGIRFKNWCEYQPSAEEYEEKQRLLREKRSANGKKGADARWAMAKDGKANGKTMAKDGKANGKTMANVWQTDSPEPEPEPISIELKDETDFLSNEVIPDSYLDLALKHPKVDPLGEWRRFRNYYLSAPLKNAKNYDGVWKAWLEKAALRPALPSEAPAYADTRAKEVAGTQEVMSEMLLAKKRAIENPAPKCEHGRVAVLCCNS